MRVHCTAPAIFMGTEPKGQKRQIKEEKRKKLFPRKVSRDSKGAAKADSPLDSRIALRYPLVTVSTFVPLMCET
jgi:hypothetical protein